MKIRFVQCIESTPAGIMMMPTDGLSCITNFTSAKVASSGRPGLVRKTHRTAKHLCPIRWLWTSYQPESVLKKMQKADSHKLYLRKNFLGGGNPSGNSSLKKAVMEGTRTASSHIGIVVPSNGLWVRVPCPPLESSTLLKSPFRLIKVPKVWNADY